MEDDKDDYELLQDKDITSCYRPKPGSKFEHLKKARRNSNDEERYVFD